MEHLHGDSSTGSMYRVGDDPVPVYVSRGSQSRNVGIGRTLLIDRYTAGDDETDAAPCALGIEGAQTLEAVDLGLEAQMHRAHQCAIAQCHKAEVQRLQKMRIRGH